MSIAQEFPYWGVLKTESGARICYYDSYGNLCGLVCVMPKDKDWFGSTENAELIVKLFNKYGKREKLIQNQPEANKIAKHIMDTFPEVNKVMTESRLRELIKEAFTEED